MHSFLMRLEPLPLFYTSRLIEDIKALSKHCRLITNLISTNWILCIDILILYIIFFLRGRTPLFYCTTRELYEFMQANGALENVTNQTKDSFPIDNLVFFTNYYNLAIKSEDKRCKKKLEKMDFELFFDFFQTFPDCFEWLQMGS